MNTDLDAKLNKAKRMTSVARKDQDILLQRLDMINKNLVILCACALSQHPNKYVAALGRKRLITELSKQLLPEVLKDAGLEKVHLDDESMFSLLLDLGQDLNQFFELDFELSASRQYLQSLLNDQQQRQNQ